MSPATFTDPSAHLASTFYSLAVFGFVPVALEFKLFHHLVEIGPTATAQALTDACNASGDNADRKKPYLPVRLTEDTMYALSALSLVDYVDTEAGDTFRANNVTKYIVETPSVIPGMDHFTKETLWAAAFLMRKLRSTNFEYPFPESQTAIQFGYKAIGKKKFAREHMFNIMAKQGRLDMFNLFMEGKFGKFGLSMPERVKSLGYNLDSLIRGTRPGGVVMVDVGGGRGEQLRELHEAYPDLTPARLILQENQAGLQEDGHFVVQEWDFKTNTAQPILGARAYSVTHVFHNLSDELALDLMRKLAAAMEAGYSRLLIQEFSRNANYGKIHAAMIVMLAGRTRSRKQWREMAGACGLNITFEVYPELGEGLIEMVKDE